MTAPQQPAGRIDDRVLDEAKNDIVEVIGRYLDLKKEGPEHVACCPFHSEKSSSFKVNGVKGFFHCFGCGAHGDAIDFVMKYEGVKLPEALERIVGRTAMTAATPVKSPRRAQPEATVRPIRAVPDSAEPPNFHHSRLGDPSKVWTYMDAEGQAVGYVARFEVVRNGRAGKETLPMCWTVQTDTGEMGWQWCGFAVPRLLYGAELLAQHPGRPVMVVEGEKSADAARRLFTGFVVVTWPGGANGVDVAEWSLLTGRDVVLWGDWDWKVYKEGHEKAGELVPEREQIGTKAMERIYAHLRGKAQRIRFVKPLAGSPDGWDLADAPPYEGFVPLKWASENTVLAQDYFEAPATPAAPEAANDNQQPEHYDPMAATAGREFPAPLDVFGIQQPPDMPIELLPACFQQYTSDQADLTGCDPGIIGLGALVAAAACIHDGIRLQPKRHDQTWTESARLWVAFVGDPSTKKSPGISKAVRHVKRIDHGMAGENAKAQADHKRQIGDWKEAKKADRNLPAAEPKPPAIQRLLVEDITVEALTEVLKDNPRGMLTLKDELTGWFASMDAYKGGKGGASMDRAHWLEAYNGGRRTIDRVTRGAIVVPNWSTCIIGGIQPDMIRRVVNSMGNDGLLQRFMVFCAKPAKADADRMPDMMAMGEFRDLFDHLIAVNPHDKEVVILSEAAHQSRERVAGYAKRLISAVDHAHIQAWLGKWDGLYARLLLAYHALECVAKRVHPVNEMVCGEVAEQVERLMCAVLLPHAIHFYTEVVDANERQQSVRQLARMILARGITRLTTRDMARQWKASQRMERWELRSIIDSLATMGWLEPDNEAIDSDGKPRAWHINPAVHDTFKQHAEREANRRRDAVEALRELRDTYQPRVREIPE